MAQKVTITMVDDLDGHNEATEIVRFGIGGTSYEIDLNADHAAQLRAAFAPFIMHGRKARPAVSRNAPGRGARAESASIREWARQRGHKMNDRGRIPAAIVAEYTVAMAARS